MTPRAYPVRGSLLYKWHNPLFAVTRSGMKSALFMPLTSLGNKK